MHLIPSEGEVIGLLMETGALRFGYYRYPNGIHSNEYMQIALAMRYYQHARTLSVALSRKLRANPEIRAIIPQLSVVAPATGGLPVAYGIVEALRARQVYWAEEDVEGQPQRFRQYIEPEPGEKILLVDDILRSGAKLTALKKLCEDRGAQVVGLAVMVYQPTPKTPDFGALPLYYLARLDARYYSPEEVAELQAQGAVFEQVWA
jgi:orotate phosphoribosyltransferase